jgi:hypothetical protein
MSRCRWPSIVDCIFAKQCQNGVVGSAEANVLSARYLRHGWLVEPYSFSYLGGVISMNRKQTQPFAETPLISEPDVTLYKYMYEGLACSLSNESGLICDGLRNQLFQSNARPPTLLWVKADIGSERRNNKKPHQPT